jgi:hypothetical protein
VKVYKKDQETLSLTFFEKGTFSYLLYFSQIFHHISVKNKDIFENVSCCELLEYQARAESTLNPKYLWQYTVVNFQI